jgi:DNA polymerase-1
LRYTLCCNAPIQGACADVVMLAMIATDRALREASIAGGLVLSVHDELVLEVPEDRADEASTLLRRSMESAFATVFPKAPLADLVKLGCGRTWGGAK